MAEIFNVTQIPGLGTDELPALPLEREEKSRIICSVHDPLWDIDAYPLTYTNSRRFAFVYEADETNLKRCLPECCLLEDDVVEFWYGDHNHTRLGPYREMGVTIAASHNGVKFGYDPFRYGTLDAALDAGRVLGFPNKAAYIRTLEHGGKWDDGYELPGRENFSVMTSRNGYVIHSATGTYSGNKISDLPRVPIFHGKNDWGWGGMKITTNSDLSQTLWQLTRVPAVLEGEICMQLKKDSITTAQASDINWFMQASPFDNLGHMLPAKKLLGLFSYDYDGIIPPAQVIWSQVIQRTPAEIEQHCIYETAFHYGMRSHFPKLNGL
jgi:hypothetical protein